VEVLQKFYESILITSIWEWIAVVTSVLYVILMSFHKITAWYFAGISSGLYVYICFEANLFLDAILQVFYVGMAIYGWYSWNSKSQMQKLKRLSIKPNLLFFGIGIIISSLLGCVFSVWTLQASPYLDAVIFVFSIIATYQATQSIIENWLLWIIIDLAAIYIFGLRELYLTSFLYLIYAVMSVIGYFTWLKIYKTQLHD
jgi:nicotinamide mononucleotide transporter